MLISLDYDETYTRDPVFWLNFVRTTLQGRHTVVCITMRYPTEPVDDVLEKLVKVIYTSRRGKRAAAWEAGLSVDVWIDDMPYFIDNDARGAAEATGETQT